MAVEGQTLYKKLLPRWRSFHCHNVNFAYVCLWLIGSNIWAAAKKSKHIDITHVIGAALLHYDRNYTVSQVKVN